MVRKALLFAWVLAAGVGAGMAQTPNPNDSDFNSDGENDLLWQQGVGHIHTWLMHGLERIGGPQHTVPISEPGTTWWVSRISEARRPARRPTDTPTSSSGTRPRGTTSSGT